MTIKCVDCEERIPVTERFHKEYTYSFVDGMPKGDSPLRQMGFPNNICCDCLGHDIGTCKKEIDLLQAEEAFSKEFNKACLRSTGGIGRQGLKL